MPHDSSFSVSIAAVDSLASYDLLRTGCGQIDLSTEAAYLLVGEDRKGWLQGQSTQELRSLTPGTFAAFCVCTPTGQLLAIVDAGATDDAILLSTARACGPAIETRVEQMVIMEDVELIPFSGRRVSVQGPYATRELSTWLDLPTLDAGSVRFEGGLVHAVRNNRTGLGGWDLWLVEGQFPAALDASLPALDPAAVGVAELEWGRPAFGVDANERTLPPELGPAFEAKAISYTKGCYTGQEVLMRMHSRGHTNRTWMGLRSDQLLPVGSTVSHSSRADAGVVTRSAESPEFGYIAAAMIRNSAAYSGELVRVQTPEGEVGAELIHLPFLRFE